MNHLFRGALRADSSNRIRRVKCDETKPSCMRCMSTGRICDGYQSLDSSNWEIATSNSMVSLYNPSSDPKLLGDTKAGPSLEFFRLETVVQFSSLFKSSFWEDVILRAAQNNDIIWHAVLAVGAAHREIELRGDGCSDEWAVKHYNKAIGHLTRRISVEDPLTVDITLTVCLLFIAFEVFL